MADDFTKFRFQVLEAAVADPSISHLDFRVLFVIAKHTNWETRMAHPGIETIAKLVGTTTRAARGCCKSLEDSGFIDRKISHGRGHSNQYRIGIGLKKRNDAAGIEVENRKSATSFKEENRKVTSDIAERKPEATRTKTGTTAHENRKPRSHEHLSEHLSEPFEALATKISTRKESKLRKPKSSKTGMPSVWPTASDEQWAIDRWTGANRHDLIERLPTIVARCRDHHLAKGTNSADWNATWRTWALNEQDPPWGKRKGQAADQVGGMSAARGIELALGERR